MMRLLILFTTLFVAQPSYGEGDSFGNEWLTAEIFYSRITDPKIKLYLGSSLPDCKLKGGGSYSSYTSEEFIIYSLYSIVDIYDRDEFFVSLKERDLIVSSLKNALIRAAIRSRQVHVFRHGDLLTSSLCFDFRVDGSTYQIAYSKSIFAD